MISSGILKLASPSALGIFRTLAFVVICAFGYGLLTVWLTSLLAQQLAKLPNLYLVPVIFTMFFTLGMYAQKQRHI